MNLEVKLSRKHITKVLDWCLKTYGKSKYNKIFPSVSFRKQDYYTEGCMAFYDDEESVIHINKDQHEDLEELVNTVIHEYIHYKQNMKHYQIISLYLPDDKNPLEIEADEIAERDTKKCLKEVFGIES